MKRIDATATVRSIVRACPAARDAMVELGLTHVSNAAVLNTAGRVMTLKKGLASRGVTPEKAKAVFGKHGMTLEGLS